MNTLEIVNVLEKRNFARDEAIELAEAINGKSGLATKEDITELRTEVKGDNTELRAEVKGDIAEVKKDIAEVKKDIAELKEDIAKVNAKLDTKATKEDIAEVNAKLDTKATKEDIAELRTSNKWIMAIGVALIMLLVKIAFFPNLPPAT